ncbi:uncharacterized protein N7506_005404 [Penicillium brevicompactum]|uniref:uncharacterized protein n=1 Tax=Penicillium brevicompactum TaxID=5074 RepID=UPI0025424566|nr:uncharacterized protein N7506_005404 [Penicillium brevicompactum]KAJ5337382.1 hypothetical protein N7506_005404 [Penicillium brevicompactum]
MASTIPERLRSADIGRFPISAAQIEKVKPVVAYWCNFHIVNHIIKWGLHNSKDRIKIYTTNLVDKLEQFKGEHSDDETVMDSIAASALIEHFGLEVFTRAEAAMSADKVTKQPADTFQAAAVFLELYQIWGALDLQISGRIKFAKYHAVRFVKAIKNGEDPNSSNPVPKDEEQKSITAQEVQAFDESLAEQAYRPTQPPTEVLPEEPDHLRRPLAQQSSHDEPLHSFRASSLQWPLKSSTSGIPSIARNAPGSPGRTMDIDQPQPGGLELPSTPGTIGGSSLVPNLPDIAGTSTFGEANASNHLNTFHSFLPPTANSPVTAPDPPFFYGPSSTSAHIPHPAALPSRTPPVTRAPVASVPTIKQCQPPPLLEDQSISLAQKHVHWALSALEFEDVFTAVKELKNSLRYLGAG